MVAMPNYAYRAIDPDGREKKGRISGANDSAVRDRLQGMRLYVVSVEESARGSIATTPIKLPMRRKLSAKQLTLFTRQMASLIEVSPLEETLRNLSRQNEKATVKDILGNVHGGVLEGQRFSEALNREPASFPPLYRAMIAAGEGAGTLPIIANRLADLLERQAKMRGKLIGALAYPVILAVVAMLVVTGLMVAVVPRVVEQFDNAQQQLPFITRMVIGISAFLASYWWVIAILLVLAGIAFWQALRIPEFRLSVDRTVLRLPLIGRLLRDLHAARMARTLATMVSSRLPLLEGLKLTGNTIHNRVLAKANDDIVERVRTGGSLSGAMQAAGVFPPLLIYLTASGESAGRLDTMLGRAADYLEQEFDNFTTSALALLEPAIIVVMGGMVAVIILAILLPILQLQNLTGL
jgi:general secretion pathway protein F